MKLVVGSDHAGFPTKAEILAFLKEKGHEVLDVGTHSAERADYPEFGQAVGLAVADGVADFGVAVCGSGQGICMAANKVPGVRGGVIRDVADAEMTRMHNDANVACFGERITNGEDAIDALRVFLATPFEGGRHEARVEQLGRIDSGETLRSN